jgi:condensin complex subunit 1
LKLGAVANTMPRFPPDHPISECIAALLTKPTKSPHWFSFAEHGINAIYISTETPDKTCSKILKELTRRLFTDLPSSTDENLSELADGLNLISLENSNKAHPPLTSEEAVDKSLKLAQLIFVAGHIGIQQIVHIEKIESEWKRRKQEKEKNKGSQNSKEKEELEMVTGSAEDEFADVLINVRERELLFDPKSLLATFAPITAYVCSNRQKFNVRY